MAMRMRGIAMRMRGAEELAFHVEGASFLHVRT